MRPDLQFSLLCDDIRIENNGKFILIGLFDNIAAPTIPVVHPKFVIVNRWGKGEGDFAETSRIVRADDNRVVAQSREVRFKLESMDTLHNTVSGFKNVKFPAEGKYWVEILLDGELARSFNFYIRKSKNRGEK